MLAEVAAGGFHQEEMHRLVVTHAARGEPVDDLAHRRQEADAQARLLAGLAHGSQLDGLASLDAALGQAPAHRRAAPDQCDLTALGTAAHDDPPG